MRQLSRFVVVFALVSAGLARADDRDGQREPDYVFEEIVRVDVVNGVPTPQFGFAQQRGPESDVGDTLFFTANINGEDKRGRPITGTMHGTCAATGVEARDPPACGRRNPDGTCQFFDPRSPLFVCTQVLKIVDPDKGREGFSTLTLQGFVRQIEAGGNPPGQNQKPQWLAITGGTGRFSKARGEIRFTLRDNPVPPPVKDVEVYLD